MKRNLNKFIGIALVSSLGFSACHKKAVTEEPGLALLLANAISSAASGACAISINASGLYYGQIQHCAINGCAGFGLGATFVLADYNAATGKGIDATAFAALPQNVRYDAFYTDSASWGATQRNARLATSKTQVDAATGNAWANHVGTGVLACARIPKTNCSVTGVTTATRAIDITNSVAIFEALQSNTDCRKPGYSYNAALAKSILRGAPDSQAISLSTGTFTNTSTNGTPTSTTGISTAAGILAEKMYPKFGSLVGLGFGILMPMTTGTTAFPTDTNSSTVDAFKGGGNLAVTQVGSCESLGLFAGTTPDTPDSARKALTPPSEVAYALSTNGLAAAAYNATVGGTSIDSAPNATVYAGPTAADAQACNASFRKKSPISVALGGGTLPAITGQSGDGGATSLLSLCVYGSTYTKRGRLQATLATGLGLAQANITECGSGNTAFHKAELAKTATIFAEMGTTSTDFPNTN